VAVGRILCLDYGRKRIGVSVSDPFGKTAQPMDTWVGLGEADLVGRIREVIEREGVDRIVVGYPLTLGGEKGPMTKVVDRFIRFLTRFFSVPVVPWDERLSSAEAQRILHRVHKKPSRMKKQVDLIASMLILQSYLDFQQCKHNRESGAD
jgi:putative holliday junction resolvase